MCEFKIFFIFRCLVSFFSFFPSLLVCKNTSPGMLWLYTRLEVQSQVKTVISSIPALRHSLEPLKTSCSFPGLHLHLSPNSLSWGYFIIISMVSCFNCKCHSSLQQLLWCFRDMLISKAQLTSVTWLLCSHSLWTEIFCPKGWDSLRLR